MKLIKNILFLFLMLSSETSFIAAQDDTTTAQNETVITQDIAQNNEIQTPTLNPLESLYTQYKEFGKITVDPENLENTIALLKKHITQLEQKKPSFRKISMYHTENLLNIGTFFLSSLMTFKIIPQSKREMEINNSTKYSYLGYWQELKNSAKIFVLLFPLLIIASPFTTYYFFKKIHHTFESVQDIANDIALNQIILQQLKKELQRISNEKAN